MGKTVVLAYSGGLDTSAIIPWLKEVYSADVVAYCADLGNGPDARQLGERSRKLGAADFIFEDLQEVFAAEYVFPMLRAGAVYQEDYLLGTAIARPLIARQIARHAERVGAYGVAHGATGKGNDHLRFEKVWATLIPDLKVIAPWKEWSFQGRSDLLNYLKSQGHPFEADVDPQFSVDANLFHCSTEGGCLEELGGDYAPEEVFKLTNPDFNGEVSEVDLRFDKGFLTHIDGKAHAPQAAVGVLNDLGARHGVGVVDLVEERMNGLKSRGVYETPGGSLIALGLKQLKSLCWDRKLLQLGSLLAREYGQLVYDGDWHMPVRESLEGFFERAARKLRGRVGLRLKGSRVQVICRQSPFGLYRPEHVSFENDGLGFYQASRGYSQFATYPNRLAGVVEKREARFKLLR